MSSNLPSSSSKDAGTFILQGSRVDSFPASIRWVPKAFTGFEVEEIKIMARGGLTYVVKKIVSPVTGIHSEAWAKNVKAQDSLLFQLPPELREKMNGLSLLLEDDRQTCLEPIQLDRRFTSFHDRRAFVLYSNLSLVCRQFYVDVVGSGLLYRTAEFMFKLPDSTYKYVLRINPFHANTIRSLKLEIDTDATARFLPVHSNCSGK